MTGRMRIILLATAGALTLAACGSSTGGSAGGAYGNSPTSAPTTSAGVSVDSAAVASGTTLAVVSTPSRGEVLVDGAGRTLYQFEKDSGTTSACTGGCLSNWPPLTDDGTVAAGKGVDAAKIGSANGQVTYNGHLLYYFAGDTAPGDMKGVDIEAWYPVTPAGGSAEPQ